MYRTVLIVLASGLAAVCDNSLDESTAEFQTEFNIFHETGNQSDRLRQFVSEYGLSSATRYSSSWQVGDPRVPPTGSNCALCAFSTTMVLDAYARGETADVIVGKSIEFCVLFNIHAERVCRGIVKTNAPVLQYVFENTPNLTSSRICAIAFQGARCGKDDPSLDWSVDLGGTPKPDLVSDRKKTSMVMNAVTILYERTIGLVQRRNKHEPNADPIHVLQITDIHFDPNYLVGGNAECGEPMCCRSDQGVPEFENATAGRWGDYRDCDIPWEVVLDAFAHIKKEHKQIDYIYMTGDVVDHGLWDTNRTHNNESLVKLYEELKNTFPDIPVFPCLGNHEAHPQNVFAPSTISDASISTAWLYETLADLWSAWLPADTRETILRGGFYTVLVRPGFRVVTLNNMQCYVNNFFLLHDTHDPDGQLQWLVEVLQEAEKQGERVHLLYHIPPGSSDCYKVWSREFHRIINRFESTVRAQFCGHTHSDETHIFYSNEEPHRATNVVFNAGSLTAFRDVNSNYRMYSVDAITWDVLDHETWIYNMTEANLSPADTLNWYKMYSFKEAYGVTSLSPVELDRLAQTMATDRTLLQQYFRFYNLKGDPHMKEGCDEGCLLGLLCDIVTSDSSSSKQCDSILKSANHITT